MDLDFPRHALEAPATLIAFALAVATSLASPSALSTEAESSIEELVVAASRLPTNLAKLSSSITLLSKEDIARRNPSNVVQLLRGIEGVQISQPGGRGGIASLYLRGGEANFTSVFIDGVKVNNPNNTRGGSFDFTTLDLANIERVEIIRGPQSAIYGSDALSGVVNFISDRSQENEIRLKLEHGEQGFSRAFIRANRALSSNHQLSVGAAETKDRSAMSGGDFESTSLSASLRGRSRDQSSEYQLHISSADSTQSRFPEDSGGALLAQMRTLEHGTSEDLQASLRVSKTWNSAWESQLLITHYERDEFSNSPGVSPGRRDPVPANSFDSNLLRRYLQLSSRFSHNNYSVSIGADLQTEEALSTGEVLFAPGFAFPSAYTMKRDIAGAFVDGNIELSESLTLLASLRFDEPDRAESRFSPSIGVIHRLPDGRSELRANWSRGFKLPSFFALASPLVGNPKLREEEVSSFDVEFSHSFSRSAELHLSLFDSKYKDLVDFDSQAFINVNRAEVSIRGAESSMDISLSQEVTMKAFVSYNDIDVRPSGKLRQRTQWQGGMEINFDPSDAVELSGRLSRLGDSFDSSIPTGDGTLDAYTRVDITASWRHSAQLRLNVAVDNVLDEQYFEAIGFPAIGRRLRIAIDWRF